MPDHTLQGQYAGFVSRAIAWVVDLIVVSLTVFTLFWVTRTTLLLLRIDITNCPTTTTGFLGIIADFCTLSRLLVSVASLLFTPIYFIFFWMLGGQTIGKYVSGVRVVQLDGQSVGFRTALVRVFGYAISLIPLGAGFLWSILDDERQGWHDKFAKTCVIYAWKAVPDEGLTSWLNKRLRLQHETPLAAAITDSGITRQDSSTRPPEHLDS